MQRWAIIIWNIAPYALFSILGFAAILLEYFLGKSPYSDFFTKLLWSYYVFPLLLLGMNFVLLQERNLPARVYLSIGSGLLFLVIGYALMLLFVSTRIEVGLPI